MNDTNQSIVNLFDLTGAQPIPPALLQRTETDLTFFLERAQPIIEQVRLHGDAALIDFARKFDGVNVDNMSVRVDDADFEEAFGKIDQSVIKTIEFAAKNIRSFHEAQMPEDIWLKELQPGVFAGDRNLPIDSVACYVPRGKGSFPSVLLQAAIPAVVAGVPRVIVLTPPGPDGKVDPATLVAARLVGIREVYKCGGAQAVAAVAFGTCLKIVGPGSPWVVAAKRLLSELIDPGVPAGPSESLILADETTDGRLAALDLLVESEHGADSSAFLVTNSRAVAEQARAYVVELWGRLEEERARFSKQVLCGSHGGIVLTDTFEQALDFVNEYAPEHLQVLAAEPMDALGKIRNASEVLLGSWTPIPLGNYVLGPNAVLPTGGKAKITGPLSVFDYMKRNSIGYVTRAGYPALAAHAEVFATYEGFEAHAMAVSPLRMEIMQRAAL